MKTDFSKVLEAYDHEDAHPMMKIVSFVIWLAFLFGFCAICLFFAYVFH